MPLVPLRQTKSPIKSATSQVALLRMSPAPVGGLNFRDSIANMPVQDALILKNFIPKRTGTELRAGWQYKTEALENPIGSMFSYNAGENSKLFAASNGGIWDVTVEEPVLESGPSGSNDNIWVTTQFSNGAGNFLLAVSPGAGYWTYDGTTWTQQTITGMTGEPTSVMVWKNRVWFTVEDDSQVYYLDTIDAITGTAVAFEMGSVLRNGGHIRALINWTMDAGVGIDDYLVVVGSEGDVAVWQGTDPTDPTQFGQKGIWYVGPIPNHGNFFTSYGGDVMLLSELGLVPISRLVNGQFSADLSQGPSAKVQPVLSPLVTKLRDVSAFDLQVIASQEILLIKLPPQGAAYEQYAMNVNSGAWCTLNNMPMTACCLFGGKFYFATDDNRVALGFTGSLDQVEVDGSLGEAVQGDVQTAFNAYDAPGQLKQFVMARPIFICTQPPSIKVRLNTQYSTQGVAGSPSFVAELNPEWDVDKWNIARWASASNVYQIWVGVTGLGYYGSLRMRVRGLGGSTTFSSFHVMGQIGGVM